MKKRWIALPLLLALLLLGYLVAGPFLAVNGIRDAIKTQNTAKLARHVDFPTLRSNLKLQLDDYVVRQAGADMQSSLFGAIAVRLASTMVGGTVDVMVTPVGLGGLMQGRSLWQRVNGRQRSSDAYAPVELVDPLADAEYGFKSTSRFTATVQDDAGRPVVFVLTRDGLSWKLSDIRLPLDDASKR